MKQSIFELGQVADRALNVDLSRHLDRVCNTDDSKAQDYWSEGLDELCDLLRKAEDALVGNDVDEVRIVAAEMVMHLTNLIGDES